MDEPIETTENEAPKEKYWQTKRKEFIDKLIEDTEKNKHFPWETGYATNFATQKSARLTEVNRVKKEKAKEGEEVHLIDAAYNGANQIRLAIVGAFRGYKDNRWATYNQIKALGGHVKKGAKAVPIEHWQEIKPKPKTEEEKEALVKEQEKEEQMEKDGWISLQRPKMTCAIFQVFNLEETEGLPQKVLDDKDAVHTIAPQERTLAMENMIKNSEAPVFQDQTSKNFYVPSLDRIHVMPPQLFQTIEGYYGTVAHEIGHSTGHESRLNREGITKSASFGSKRYAREELVAELTSVFLTQAYGVSTPYEEQNHEAYLQSWDRKLNYIKENKEDFFKVLRDASAAADYIRDHMVEKGLTKEQIEQIRGYSPEETAKFKKEDKENQKQAYKEKKAARAKAARKKDRGRSL